MSGASVQVKIDGLDHLQQRLERLGAINRAELLASMGALVESQTRRRITSEKTSPQGEPWADWSERYARTRHANQSLLVSEGHLRDSITFNVTGDQVEVGTNLIYGATHQLGREEIPERPYLGLSPTNEHEVIEMIEDYLDHVVNG